MRAVVQVLHGLFYVLLQLLVVAAVVLNLSFNVSFIASFNCSCGPSIIDLHSCLLADPLLLVSQKAEKNVSSFSSIGRFLV